MVRRVRKIRGKVIPTSRNSYIVVAAGAYEGIHKKAYVLKEYVQDRYLVIEYRPKKFSRRKNIGKCVMILYDLKLDSPEYKVELVM